MTKFELVENGEVVGYVDTEVHEYEYAGSNEEVEEILKSLGKRLDRSSGYTDVEPTVFEGSMVETVLRDVVGDETKVVETSVGNDE